MAPGIDQEGYFANILKVFLESLEGKKASEIQSSFAKFGEILDKMKINEIVKPGELTKWVIDDSSKEALKKAGFFSKSMLTNADAGVLKAVRDIYADLLKEDPSERKVKLSECMGEILLFGCGKEYFEAGGAGENIFLNSKDDQYYADIAKTSNELYGRRKGVKQIIAYYYTDPEKQEEIFIKLKPILAGMTDSMDSAVMTENIRKYGVANTRDLINKLDLLFGNDAASRERLAQSKARGEVFKARRDYIDNFGTGDKKGKFRIVRDYMIKDPATWNKIMTLSDSEFVDFINEQDRLFGKGLDVFMSKDYRGSQPINEQYIMANWSDFKKREGWT